MRQVLMTVGLTAMLAVPAGAQPDPLWVNNGVITFPPQVDAINAVNNGLINIATSAPFDTSNTRNFTNNGTMNGAVGFRFDTVLTGPGGGGNATRQPAVNFHNKSGATVTSRDSFLGPSRLSVLATNIVNRGYLGVGANGALQLTATNADLFYSALGAGAIEPRGSGNDLDGGQFSADVAIYDYYWGQTNADWNSANLMMAEEDNLFVVTPPHYVEAVQGRGMTQFYLENPIAAFYTNFVGGQRSLTLTNLDGSVTNLLVATNIIRQAAFASVADTNIAVVFRFAPSPIPTNHFQTVTAGLAWSTTNLFTGEPAMTTLYLRDTLASSTARGLLVNPETGNTYRPANYLLSRLEPSEFANGNSGNAALTNNFLYEEDFTNHIVGGAYAGYSASVDNIYSRPPKIAGGTVTNLPGRVIINAQNLNLEEAAVRAEGYVDIKTRHLVSSTNAIVDSEHLIYDLASTNGLLVMTDLAKETVARMRGDLYVWSGVWQNELIESYTSYNLPDPDDEEGGEPEEVVITNAVRVGIHALVISADYVLTELPVITHDLKLHSRQADGVQPGDIIMADPVTVARGFYLDGESFTLSGRLRLSEEVEDWIWTNAPGVMYLTNTGVLQVPNELHLGNDRSQQYEAIVNQGIISAYGQNYRTRYFENRGTNFAGANVTVTAEDAKLDDGQFVVDGNLTFTGGILRMREHALDVSSGTLYLDLSTSLGDTGGGANNTIAVGDGFWLMQKPATGDLLGTRLLTAVSASRVADHYWAAEDRGPVGAGFLNNVAIGRLTLSAAVRGKLRFYGVGSGRALYVDYLELDTYVANNLETAVHIDPGFKIYFADANVRPEELDGKFGGRLIWVRDFAGPNSSVSVVLPGGKRIKVNRGVLTSTIIDSDADGLANAYDPSPFDPVPLGGVTLVSTSAPPQALITWRAAANTVYYLEYRTDLSPLAAGGWQPLLVFTNQATTNGWITVEDPLPVVADPRYYRLYYRP